MKNACLTIATTATIAAAASAQTIVAGPIHNPSNGARYYLINAGSWTAANSAAQAMGGQLASIASAAENDWIRANIVVPHLVKPWLGLNNAQNPNVFTWSDGSSSAFRAWAPGEPNGQAGYNYVRIRGGDGLWETRPNAYSPEALVKITGPVRVPQEFPTLAGAIAALPNTGTTQILLAPGTHTVASTITTPENYLVNIFSASGATLRGPSTGEVLSVSYQLLMRNITIEGNSESPLIRLAPASILHSNFCTFRALQSSLAASIDLGPNAVLRADGCSFSGGGFAVTGSAGSEALIRSSVIEQMRSVAGGSGLTSRFLGCTITKVGPGALFVSSTTNIIRGCIVWGNTGPINPGTINSQWSNFQTPQPGFMNISADPLFVDHAGGNYRLRPFSPCIDRGTIQVVTAWIADPVAPFLDRDGKSRLADDRSMLNRAEGLPPADMGAFEFQGDSCPADFNGDGQVDFFDYLDFVNAYSAGCD